VELVGVLPELVRCGVERVVGEGWSYEGLKSQLGPESVLKDADSHRVARQRSVLQDALRPSGDFSP